MSEQEKPRVEVVKLAIWLSKRKAETWPLCHLIASDFRLSQNDRKMLAEFLAGFSVPRPRGRPRGAPRKSKIGLAVRAVKQTKDYLLALGQKGYGRHPAIVEAAAKKFGVKVETLENAVRRSPRARIKMF